jgi:hypothetical protein
MISHSSSGTNVEALLGCVLSGAARLDVERLHAAEAASHCFTLELTPFSGHPISIGRKESTDAENETTVPA